MEQIRWYKQTVGQDLRGEEERKTVKKKKMLNMEKWMVTNPGVHLSGKRKKKFMCAHAHAHATTCFCKLLTTNN